MTKPLIHVIPALSDNYGFVIQVGADAIVIDPSEPRPFLNVLETGNMRVTHVLLTHGHHDHVGGVDALRDRYRALIIGPKGMSLNLDHQVSHDENIRIHGLRVKALDTPGHAFPHSAFHMAEQGWLFSGDCLFGAGCGRLSGNSADVMWRSLQLLSGLPDHTKVFFGHEYTLNNLAFALTVDPDNAEVKKRISDLQASLASGGYSVPATLAEERQTNPFLRTSEPAIRRSLGLMEATDLEVFTALRKAKDRF
ncbi:MAG TPA: hydroxyacylglutathione hydrolase [Kiritimatiellia bacterium]|nr:hydroxyacylglutathione hydrolase [Kiritimatiellia bacterium]